MESPCLRLPGTALLLTELDNIGHQSRDIVLVARALRLGYNVARSAIRSPYHSKSLSADRPS